jgi:nicotinate-nucleotide adenylyltransferase
MLRVGIYAGTFDPVHSGHITFALQALKVGNLESIYFLPERRPRDKAEATHFAHRVAMLKQALKPHPKCSVLELIEARFTVKKTLPALQQHFPNTQLVFLFGSDVIAGLASWSNADLLLKSGELIVGLRSGAKRSNIKKIIETWPTQPEAVAIFSSYAPSVSSGMVRSALKNRHPAAGLLKSVERYSNHHWLYVSLIDI